MRTGQELGEDARVSAGAHECAAAVSCPNCTQGATLEQLEAWFERILDAESVDALFAER